VFLNPGKNITVIAEVIAMNHLLRYSGARIRRSVQRVTIGGCARQPTLGNTRWKTMSESDIRPVRSSPVAGLRGGDRLGGPPDHGSWGSVRHALQSRHERSRCGACHARAG
jgi:hypothetical protein